MRGRSRVTSAVGIALAAIGPLAFGSALEATGESAVPVVGLGVVLVVHLMVGLRTGTLVDRRGDQDGPETSGPSVARRPADHADHRWA